MRLLFIACLLFSPTISFCQTKGSSVVTTAERMTLFSRVNIIDVEKGVVLPDRDVLVSNNQIISIKKHDKTAGQKQKGVVLISGQGKYLMPGLIDCHTHIIYKEDLLHYLRNGVTTVFSLGQPQAVLSFREEVKQGSLIGPSIYAAAHMDAIAQDWEGEVYTYVVRSTADVDTAIRRIKNLQYDLIKAYNSLSTQEFDEIMRLSKQYKIPVVGHGVREPGIEHILSKGMAMVAHAEEYLYTFFRDSLDEKKIPSAVAFTKKYGAFVCPNLSTFKTILTQWGDSLRFVNLLKEAGNVKSIVSPKMLNFWINENHYIHRTGAPLIPMYAFLQKLTYALYKAGVPLVAGTDSPIIPGCFPGSSMIKELQLLKESGLSTTDALKTATLVPGRFVAKYLPNEQKIGVIKEGYAADLLLLSKNPIQSIQNVSAIEGVMAKGRWYTKEYLIQLETK